MFCRRVLNLSSAVGCTNTARANVALYLSKLTKGGRTSFSGRLITDEERDARRVASRSVLCIGDVEALSRTTDTHPRAYDALKSIDKRYPR